MNRMTQGGLVILSATAMLLSVVLATMDSTGSPLFNHTMEELNKKYTDQISPEPIVFGIAWPIIYIWNAAGIAYLLVSLKLRDDISPVKMIPTLVPKGYLIGNIVTWLCSAGWLFAFDEENLELSLTLLLLSVLGVYFSLGISYKAVYDNEAKLEKTNPVTLWLMRILVQNGLGLLAGWATVASMLGLASVLVYKDSPESATAILRGGLSVVEGSTVSLAILIGVTVFWFIIENFAVEKYCRYTFTVYPMLIMPLAGLVARLVNLPDAQQNLVLACIALGVAGAAFLARIGLSIYRFLQPSDYYPYAKQLLPRI